MRFVRKFIKWFLRGLLILLLLVFLIIVALQFPAVQTRVANVVTRELASRTGTGISIERVGVRIPKAISLKGVYLEDYKADTLLYAGELSLDVQLFGLLRNHVDVKEIALRDATVNLLRSEPDTLFNYQILLNAMSGDPATQPQSGYESTDEEMHPDSDEAAPWTFDVGNIRLDNIRFRYADYFSGIDLLVAMEALHTSVEQLDPGIDAYALGHTLFSKGHVDVLITEPARPAEPPDEPVTPPDIALKHLVLQDIGFSYVQSDETVFQTSIDSLDLEPESLDLKLMRFQVKSFQAAVPGIQVAGLQFDLLNIDLQNTLYAADTISTNLKHISFAEGLGVQLDQMSADINLGRHNLVENLHLKTRESEVSARVFTSIPLMDPGELEAGHRLDILIDKGRIGKDIVAIVPELEFLFPYAEASPIDLILTANGTIGNLDVDTLELVLNQNLSVNTSGRVKGIPDMDALHLDLPLFSLSAAPPALRDYLPEELLPDGITLPQELSLIASLEGGLNDFYADVDLFTDFVEVNADLKYENGGDENPDWQADISLMGEAPLAFIGQYELLKDLHAGIAATGKGFDPETMELDMDVLIDSVTYNDYTYRSLKLTAKASEGLFDTRIGYEDENLVLDALTIISPGGTQPEMTFNWKLDHLNAQALQLTEDMIAFQTHLEGAFTMKKPDFPDGWLYVHDTYLLLERDVYHLDSLHLNTNTNDDYYLAEIHSPLIEGRFMGNVSPVEIPYALADHVLTYMGMERDPDEGYLLVDDPEVPDQHFTLSLKINPSPYFHELLLPQVDSFEAITIQTRFDSADRLLSMEANLPELIYGGWHISNMFLKADSDADIMDFSLEIPNIESDVLTIKDFHASGSLEDKLLAFRLAFSDMEDQRWLDMSGNLEQHEDYTELRLDSSMLVNRSPWEVYPDNYLRFYEESLFARDLRIQQDQKEIAIRSLEREADVSPLELSFRQIDMGRFDLIGGEALVQGILDGYFVVNDLFTDFTFTADLNIDELGFSGDTIGDVQMLVISPDPGFFELEASVKGYGNQVDLQGTYQQDDVPFMDIELTLGNLELTTLEALTFEQLSDMEGQISGNLHLVGEPANPTMDGAIHFDQVGFHAVFLNARYTIPEETILFDNNQVRFSRFTLLDRSERPARLDGTISIHDMSDIGFDLNLTSTNFLFLDIPREANELFFGTLLIDTDLDMTGDMVRPVIEGRLKLNQGSSFTFIPPQHMPETIGDEGVVEFIEPLEDIFTELAVRPEETEPMQSAFENLDISVNVELDPATDVRILIDEVAGDYLEIQGGGLITYGVDPGGRISLTGSYEISGGSYQMTFYDVIRRNFQIEPGSNIVWTGDPLDATVDITAKYTVRTSARELMASQGPDAGQQEGAFRQIYPFEVFLKMEGDLMTPEISFEVGLPAEHRGAMEGRLQSRLNELNENESELNKQVFALLIIGNFIQDDPIAAVTGGPGITSTARSSASRLLSQQLNRLSDRYIRGVDISFDLESYEQIDNGQMVGRTELQMEVSRDFLDQRLRITAGGHLELEDETRRQINPADMAGDFSVEYLLDPDGRYTLKGFRERKYQEIFEGEVIETGVSFIFRQTFTSFRELFMRKEEENEVITPDDPATQ